MTNSINSILRKEQVRTNNISKFEILYWEGYGRSVSGSCIMPSETVVFELEGIIFEAVDHCELISKFKASKPKEISYSSPSLGSSTGDEIFWEEKITFKVDNYDLATIRISCEDDNYKNETLVFVSQFFTETGKQKPF